ncbi:MAG: hypothetical protein ACT4QF_08605 [Sporichthyaceae bacterium]
MRSRPLARTLVRFAVFCGVTAGSLVALPAPAEAAAPPPVDPANTAFVTMHTPSGPWYYAGQARSWRSDVDQVSFDHSPDYDYLRVGTGSAALTFSRDGAQFPVGEYGSDCTAECTVAGVSGYADGAVCTGGRFQVHAASADLGTLWLTYQLSCGIDMPYFGEIRRNHPGAGPAFVVGERMLWPAKDVGATADSAPVTLYNPGVEAVQVGTPAVVSGAADFAVVGNTCGTVPAGGSCVLTVRHSPAAEGPRAGSIVVGFGDAEQTILLGGAGIGGHTAWSTWTEHGSGLPVSHNPSDSLMVGVGNPRYFQLKLATALYEPVATVLLSGCEDVLRAGQGTCYLELDGYGSGQATIHESEVVGETVTSLSLTYSHRRGGDTAWRYGSIAWRAIASPQPLPGVVGANPVPVRDFAVEANYSSVNLSWADSPSPDWSEVQVWFAPGTTAPAKPGEGYLAYRGRKNEAHLPGLHPNNSYAFAAFVKDSEGRWSARSRVAVTAKKLTLKVNTGKVAYGDTVTLEGTFAKGAYQYVDIAARVPGTDTWYLVETVSTNANGYFYAYHAPARTYDYYAFFNGEGTQLGSASAAVRVTVAKDVVAWGEKTSGRLGSTFKIGAGVNPVATGKTITLERYSDGKWRKVASAKTLGTKATYFGVKPSTRGTHSYRVVAASGSGLAAGKSVTIKIRVT